MADPTRYDAPDMRIPGSVWLQPVHTTLIAGFGSNIFNNMDLEALAETAAAENRWEFMLTAGPIPVGAGTGSPLNPIAMF